MTHEHCDKCYSLYCSQTSECPMVLCQHGCSASMHSCKIDDHQNVCPNVFVPCSNVNYGCPVTVRRCHLSKHLPNCAASVIFCPFRYKDQCHSSEHQHGESFTDHIARRDNLWSNHLDQLQQIGEVNRLLSTGASILSQAEERLIRSEKYPYITMPECILSKNDGIICITCRLHLRQLEENEEQRLALVAEEERLMQMQARPGTTLSSEPSLVQFLLTRVNGIDLSQNSNSANATTTSSDLVSRPNLSDIELESSLIHRFKYFSSDRSQENVSSFVESPSFVCAASYRRDEMEQHWQIHHSIDCHLTHYLYQRCPKYQYGCPFQIQRIEPCRSNGEPIRFWFDHRNDAIAFDFHPSIEPNNGNTLNLLDLPIEILMKILQNLDSLSLRNLSLVSRQLRLICQELVSKLGIVTSEYERQSLSHGELVWIERRQHWMFSNTSSWIPRWKFTDASTAMMLQHLIHCPYGETKDLQNEPPYPLVHLACKQDQSEKS